MTSMRKHLAEIQAIAAEMTAALDRGEQPTVLEADIIEYRATTLAVEIRKAFIASILGPDVVPGSDADKQAQRCVETRRAS